MQDRSFASAAAPGCPGCPDAHDWKRDVPLWLPLACLSWWLAWTFQDEFIADWDGFDYTVYTIQHLPSALGLSRALFIAYNTLLWEIAHRSFGVAPEQAYLVLRYAVIAQAGPAVVGMYALGKELTADRRAAALAALLLALSPFFIIYSGRSMSEIPAFLMLNWALWWMLRSLRRGRIAVFLLAALLVGASANVREFAVFYLPFIPIAALLRRVHWAWAGAGLLLAGLAALAGMGFWAWYDTDNYLFAVRNWYRLSAGERRAHPVGWQNLRFFLTYSGTCSAAATILAPVAFAWGWMKRNNPLLLWLGGFGALANLLMLANHDLAVNPRYMLMGLVGLAPLAGWWMGEAIGTLGRRAAPVLLGVAILTQATYHHAARELYGQQWASRASRLYFEKIRDLPWNAGFIVGARTPLIHFYAGVAARPFWRTISSGAGWPTGDRIHDAIQEFYLAGRLVYVDFDPELWQAGARENHRETDGLDIIRREYELEPVRDSLYRIVRRKL